MTPKAVENYRAAAHVAVLTADAVAAGCLEKFLYIYSHLIRELPQASLIRCADEALLRALPRRGKAV